MTAVAAARVDRVPHVSPSPAKSPLAWLRLSVAAAAVTTAVTTGLCGLTAATARAQAPAAPTAAATQPAVEADPLLAERLAEIAAETLRGQSLSTAQYRQAGAFLEAASRLAPQETRFHRLRYEAMIQSGDVASAIQALVAYARLDTTDLQAQAKLIELYAQRMETAEEKLKYLRQDLVPTASIPGEVRSHAAVMAARVLLERGERRAAAQMAGEAARLNPLNPEAQSLRFDLSLRDGTPLDRIVGLLAVVRASPLELGAVMSVADELSKVGIDDSAQWYDAALGLAVRNGNPPPREMVLNYASRLFVSGQVRDADGLVTRVLQADPDDVGAHFIRLSLDRTQGDPLVVANHKALARTSLTNRLAEVALAAGDTTAATRPSATTEPFPGPDPVALAARVLARNDPALRDAYLSAVTDLAWLNLFFLEQAGPAADLVAGLKRVLPPESPLLARLEGWLYLVKGERAEARQRLSAVAAEDPLAALGLLRLEPDSPEGREAADTRARGLRSNHSHGILGAILYSDLAPRRTPLVLTPVAGQVKAQLDQFPKQLLRLIDSPQGFYFLRAEPLTASVPYGSPMLVRVTLINTSDLDLSMGAQGAIKNDVVFNVQARGLDPQQFPGTAFDRLGGPLVLRPRQQATRIVRVDQGRLLAFLRQRPHTSFPLVGSALTNPALVGGRIGSGAGGYEVNFGRVFEQAPVPIVRPEQRQALIDGLGTAPPARRVGLIDAALIYYSALAGQATPEQQEGPQRLRAAIDALASDPDPTARSYGTFWGLLTTKGEPRTALARSAGFDAYWLTRMMALAGLRGGDIESYQRLATQLTADPDPTVQKYARAVLEEVDERIAAAAATQPAAR